MDCEQAANFISARVDGELAADDRVVLDAHLAGCAACRATAEAVVLQDAELLRAWAGGRDAATALAARVSEAFARTMPASGAIPSPGPTLTPAATPPAVAPWHRQPSWWVGWVAAAAAGFVAAIVLVRPAGPPVALSPPMFPPPSILPPPAILAVDPVARLSLASGAVFTCPSDGRAWQPMAPGDGLAPGARVRTADAAKCELALPGGSRLRLNAGTELRFVGAGDVRLAGGQLWSAVPLDAGPLRVAAADACVTTGPAAAQFDVTCSAGAAQVKVVEVTVVEGTARVDGNGSATTVRGGELLRVGAAAQARPDPGAPVATPGSDAAARDAASAMRCVAAPDPLAATRWLDDLLLLRPVDDPELAARADALLGRVAADRAASADHTATADRTTVTPPVEPGPAERDLRARGDAWAVPLARFALRHRSAAAEPVVSKRRAAARLLADLATPPCVPDLIDLLADGDSAVRYHVAVALNRLTGFTLGYPPDRCAADPRDPAPAEAWRAWLSADRGRSDARP